MTQFQRLKENPILKPNKNNKWEECAAFNPCVVKDGDNFHLTYRALSKKKKQQKENLQISSVGYAESNDGINFKNHRQLIKPEHDWELFGCEDPRITKLDDKYYIFYTALSKYPFCADGIKIGVGITKDFKTIEKHPVTPFNSKAMALFPKKINGKITGILTTDTDHPPSKISIISFDKESDIWNPVYWTKWYSSLDLHVVPLLRSRNDHVELGAPPIKTYRGWLVIYSYIQNYFSNNKVFGIEAVLLDLENPLKVIGRTTKPLIVPKEQYELKGDVPNITFPSGAVLNGDDLYMYYGAADTTGCVAIGNIYDLINKLTYSEKGKFILSKKIKNSFQRYSKNPIIEQRPELSWEAKAVFNPAAVYADEKVHILYRAVSSDDTSQFGYASSKDGIHIDERLTEPVYVPREKFEKKYKPGSWSGCEDARLTRMGDEIYILYTAYNGRVPRVALSSIKVSDFIIKKWKWKKPILISPPGKDDKDACIFPEKINNKYVIIHRLHHNIYIDFVDDLNFGEDKWLNDKNILITPRKDKWDNLKIGVSCTPIKTLKGWLLLYHGVSAPGAIYKVGALLLDLQNPQKVLARDEIPLMEPEMDYEKNGDVPNVVFPCGNVLIKDEIFIYYGGGDKVVGVAKIKLDTLLDKLIPML